MEGNTIPQQHLVLPVRQQRLEIDASGRRRWRPCEVEWRLRPAETALVLCDVWDTHWCRAAHERLGALLPQMSRVVEAMRGAGTLIVHAPSDTMAFYRDTPARKRVLDARRTEIPDDLPHAQPPLPVDASGGGCDSKDHLGDPGELVWSRQHPAIRIDHANDAISDDGRELYDPARPPYVSHEEGTQLVIAYIEKFWCPTIDSGALLSAAGAR
jgi:hypothetical protein